MEKRLRRSLFIGLGGTGIKTILKTKGVMLDNYGQNGELPPILGFLGIDTDRSEYDLTAKTKHGEIKLMADERYSISVASPKPHYNQYKRDYEWLPPQNVTFINTLDRGAGQVRTNGRLAVMYHRGQLKERIRQAINDVYTAQIKIFLQWMTPMTGRLNWRFILCFQFAEEPVPDHSST